MADMPSAGDAAPPAFEAGLDQLDSLVRRMESGDLGLAESIAAYEAGVALLRRLHEELGSIEQRVKTLIRLDDDGNPVFEPIARDSAPATPADEPATTDRSTTGRRRGRKPAAPGSRSRQRLPGMDEPAETP